jgi:predicted DNA-binding transcriptional regulator AlpA
VLSAPRLHQRSSALGAPAFVPALLRTTPRAIYMMIARHQLPGVVRIRRRVLVRSSDLLDWLDQKCAPSPEE